VHSKVTLALCVEYENGTSRSTNEGAPILRAVLLPTREVNIIQIWDGSGLRSSGSHDFAIENVFVPDDCTFTLTDFNPKPYQRGALLSAVHYHVFIGHYRCIPWYCSRVDRRAG
jgi:hypothetical protein